MLGTAFYSCLYTQQLLWTFVCVCVCVQHACPTSHPPSSLIVVQIHQLPGALVRALGVALLPLACVHELLGEPVAVVEVVAAAAPQPVAGQIFGAGGAAAPAAGELPLSARAAHRVHHPRRADGISERRFSTACRRTNRNIMSLLARKETE